MLVFETMAAVSTIGFSVIFVALFQMDRANRKKEDTESQQG